MHVGCDCRTERHKVTQLPFQLSAKSVIVLLCGKCKNKYKKTNKSGVTLHCVRICDKTELTKKSDTANIEANGLNCHL